MKNRPHIKILVIDDEKVLLEMLCPFGKRAYPGSTIAGKVLWG